MSEPAHALTLLGSTAPSFYPNIQKLPSGLIAPEPPTGWTLAHFTGRFAEISGSEAGAPLTLAFRLVLEAQRQRDPVAWIARRGSVFFPPDAVAAGIDVGAVPVVRAPDAAAAARAADYLIRSGGFGLVVVDLGSGIRWPVEVQTRLTGLAHKHDTALVSLTEKDDHRPSLGSLVSLRAHTTRIGRDGSRFRCEAHVLKDKRHGPGRKHMEVFDGPHGLR